MSLLNYITWTVHPEIIPGLDFFISPRWYGMLFAVAFALGYYLLSNMLKRDGAPKEWADSALMYVMIATIIGARLGHVLFYDFEEYAANPAEILKIWNGGLASHGAAIGIIFSLWLFSRNVTKKPMIWILDRVVITVVLGGIFVRLGNLMNHEIIGTPTDLPWAFLFTRSYENNQVPVHPAQLYESISYAIIFAILWWYYRKTNAAEKSGFIFGMFLVLLWTARFLVEFVKQSQGGFESSLGNVLSTGQWLSIPFIIFGFILLFRSGMPTRNAAKA